MSRVATFRVGALTCHTLEAGRQRLDGGAMFGVVPKPLWERRIPPDERNRIPLAMRCLLIEHDAGPVLVDTGLGNKESAKFRDIYGVENAGTRGPTQLEDALADLGFAPGDVRYVVNTHLHFDHAGGNTVVEPLADGEETGTAPRLAFPNAAYVVQERELAFADVPNERTAASYLGPNFRPVTDARAWRPVDGETELLPGLRLLPTPGHVPHHQSVLVESEGQTACFLGDLVPTTAHLPLPWIMGYDLEPVVTLETKRWLLRRAVDEEWTLVFEHDPTHGVGKTAFDGRAYVFVPLDTGTPGG